MTATPRTGRPKKLQLTVSESQRQELEQIVKGRRNRSLVLRARIILKCSEGISNTAVAAAARTTPCTVGYWRNRFIRGGINALWDEPRPGAPRKIGDVKVQEAVRTVLETNPKGATHWSTRMMAQNLGLSQSTVSRIWRAFGLKPHR